MSPLTDVSERTFLIGPRYRHHCRYSGYEQFGAFCARTVPSPVSNRFLSRRLGRAPWIGDVGKWIDRKVGQMTPRPLYTIGIFLIEAAAAVHMLAHRKSIYHVLYGDTDYWLLGRIRRLSKKNKLVATFHEPGYALDWLKIDKIVPDLDAVILVSESQREYFLDLVPPERIFVAPHGIDSTFFKPAEKFSDDLVGITVGTHHRDPGSLSRALDRIYQEFPTFRLKAVGARLEGGENPALKDERVEYHDGISDEELREMYQTAGVGIFSLNQATANNAILEAMACGIAVVATDIGGVREMVGDAGVLTRYWDSDSLADGVLRVLRDRKLAARLGKAARERVLQFNYEKVAEQMRRLYAQVLENGAGASD
jgi:glycosyltransferase involved in cell wall biosynthesis